MASWDPRGSPREARRSARRRGGHEAEDGQTEWGPERGPAGALEQGEGSRRLDEALELSSKETGTVGDGRWVS